MIPLGEDLQQELAGAREAIPQQVKGWGSYLVLGSILPNTLRAGLLRDTAAFQHDLVRGTEAAF